MKIFRFALKELELIASQKATLAMMLLYPLIVVLVIALAFGGQGGGPDAAFEKADVGYLVPENSDFFDSEAFIERLNAVGRIRFHKAHSVDELKNSIDCGTATVGIEVIEPSSAFDPVRVRLYYDNSTPLVSKMILSYVQISIQLFSNEKSTRILEGIWDNLDAMIDKLYEQKAKLSAVEIALDNAKSRLKNFKVKVDAIDTDSLQGKLDQFHPEYLESKQKLANAKGSVIDSQNKLESYRAKLVGSRDELVQYRNELVSVRSALEEAMGLAVGQVYSMLNDAHEEVNAVVIKLDATIYEIDSGLVDLDNATIELEGIRGELDLTSQKLDTLDYSVNEFKSSVQQLELTLGELKLLINEANFAYDDAKISLGESRGLLDGFADTLKEFMSYQPGYLIRPFAVEGVKMYLDSEEYAPVEKTAILMPITLTIVLLLTCVLFASISTLVERKQGIDFRVRASPTNKFVWLSGKILGQMLFAIVEAMIIISIAVFVFGVPIIGSSLSLLFAVVAISFSFISIGLFLTNFTDEQSTAVLASLIIMIPFLFLSGVIFPIEFMPSYVQGIASLMPLTLGTEILTSIMVKGLPILQSVDKIALMLFPSVIMFVISVFNKKI